MIIRRRGTKPREEPSLFGGGAVGFFGPVNGTGQEEKPKRTGPFRFNLTLYGRRKPDADA